MNRRQFRVWRRKNLKNIILMLIAGIFIFMTGLSSAPTKINTITKTVTQTVEKPLPKTYVCNSDKQVDLSNCFEIDYTSANTYCFDGHCSYIYTDKEIK